MQMLILRKTCINIHVYIYISDICIGCKYIYLIFAELIPEDLVKGWAWPSQLASPLRILHSAAKFLPYICICIYICIYIYIFIYIPQTNVACGVNGVLTWSL